MRPNKTVSAAFNSKKYLWNNEDLMLQKVQGMA